MLQREGIGHAIIYLTCNIGVVFCWITGWSIGTKVSAIVANNPIQARQFQATRNVQAKTFQRYVNGGHLFPRDIAPNLCDRIHAHILFLCEKSYGPKFWPDFFQEIRKEHKRLSAAVSLSELNQIRNERYQITIECFDRLKGLDFKNILKSNQISLSIDVKSLDPTNPGWNRKFIR